MMNCGGYLNLGCVWTGGLVLLVVIYGAYIVNHLRRKRRGR